MKTTLLLWLTLMSGLVYAQTKKPARVPRKTQTAQTIQPAPKVVQYNDVIHKTDQSTISVKIDEMTDTDVLYFIATTPATRQTLPRSEVWKIVFSDGSVETITAPSAESAATTVTPATNTAAKPTIENPVPLGAASSQSTNYATAKNVSGYPKDRAFSRVHFTIGPEITYYPAGLNKDKSWLNDSTGFGMKQNIGASLRFDYQFIRYVAMSVTAGYSGWELVRKYTRDGVSEYTETKRLTQIPLQLGLKLYPFGGLYLMPEGGATLLFSTVKTSEANPIQTDESVKSMPITYGGSLGYEIRGKALLLDLSLRYQLLNVKNLTFSGLQQTLNEQVSLTTFRLGIGFNSLKK